MAFSSTFYLHMKAFSFKQRYLHVFRPGSLKYPCWGRGLLQVRKKGCKFTVGLEQISGIGVEKMENYLHKLLMSPEVVFFFHMHEP